MNIGIFIHSSRKGAKGIPIIRIMNENYNNIKIKINE